MKQITGLTVEETASAMIIANLLIDKAPAIVPKSIAMIKAAETVAFFCSVHEKICRLNFEELAKQDIFGVIDFAFELMGNINLDGCGSFKNPDYVPTYAYSRFQSKPKAYASASNTNVDEVVDDTAFAMATAAATALASSLSTSTSEPFNGNGGEFGGAGASGHWDSPDDTTITSDSSTSSDTGTGE